MKVKAFLTFAAISIILMGCSRDEPGITQVIVEPTIIKINEVYSRGVTTDPDWIEIYNAGNTAVDISGYKIYDSGGQGGTKPKMAVPAGTMLAAKGRYVIVTDIASTVDPAGFGLSSGGEEVWLEDKNGVVIDNVAFPAMDVTQSYSRIPDGGTWALTSNITKNAANR